MIQRNVVQCPKCGGLLKRYDHVKRIVRSKFKTSKHIKLRRLRCSQCLSVHREYPDYIIPYKQYDGDIIIWVLEGLITSATI